MLKSSRMRYGITTLGLVAGILSAGQVAEAATMVDQLSVWTAPGIGGNNPTDLADWIKSVSLRVDTNLDGKLLQDETVSSGQFNAATNSINNPNITYSNTGKKLTQASGSYDIWKLTFGGLNLSFPSNETVQFGVKGVGRAIPGSDGAGPNPDFFPFFLMASNAALSNYSSAAFTDNQYFEYNHNGTLNGVINSQTVGEWDKPSDILVEVLAKDGSILTDRGLPNPITAANLTRWVPPEAVFGNPKDARFKGDDFNTVPTPGLLFGAVGMGIQALRKKRQQRQRQSA